MMDTSTKYRRWGWGAVIGLIAVVLLAGLVVALSMNKKSKVADTELNADTNSGTVAVEENGNGGTDTMVNGANKDESAKNDEKAETEKGSAETKDGENAKAEEEKSKSEAAGRKDNKKSDNAAEKQDGGVALNGEQGVKTDGGAAAGDNGEMPKTGPVDATIAIIGMAVTAYLLSLNVAMAREDVRK